MTSIISCFKISKLLTNRLLAQVNLSNNSKNYYTKIYELSNSIVSFEIVSPDGVEFSLNNSAGNKFTMGYKGNNFYTNRTNSGLVDFNEKFTNTEPQKVQIGNLDTLKVKLFIDKSSIEIFLNDGNYAMTNLVYPETPWQTLNIVTNEDSRIKNVKTRKVNLELLNKE